MGNRSIKVCYILRSEVNVDCGDSVLFLGICFKKVPDFLKTKKRAFYEMPIHVLERIKIMCKLHKNKTQEFTICDL